MKSEAVLADMLGGESGEARMVGGAEGFRAAVRADGDGGVAGRVLRGLEQGAERSGVESGHVAGEHEAPLGEAGVQGGVEPADGAEAAELFLQAGIAEPAVERGGADEERAARGLGADAGGAGGEGLAGELEEGLVAAHAAAEASGEDEGRASHERIVAAAARTAAGQSTEKCGCVRNMRLYNVVNIMLAFCFACGGAAAGTPESAQGESLQAVMTVRADRRTGRLVRVTEFRTRSGRRVPAAQAVRPLVEHAARKHAVDAELVDAVIRAESGYNPAAVSVKGAAGLMQLMPETAQRLGAKNRFDLEENLEAGVKLLKQLREKYGDDQLALAAYNAGEGAVRKYNGVPPYRETVEYIRKIEAAYAKPRPGDEGKHAEPRRDEQESLRGLLVETDAEGRVYLRTR